MMESALTARDRVGVQDFVLLENHTSEVAFIENLRKRFKENLIYVRAVVPVLFTHNAQSIDVNTVCLSFSTDVHWLSAGVHEPLQRAGDLH